MWHAGNHGSTRLVIPSVRRCIRAFSPPNFSRISDRVARTACGCDDVCRATQRSVESHRRRLGNSPTRAAPSYRVFTHNSFGVLAIEIVVLAHQLLRSFLFLPPAIIIVMDLVLFWLSSGSTTTTSKHLQGLPKILLVLTRRRRNMYSIFDCLMLSLKLLAAVS